MKDQKVENEEYLSDSTKKLVEEFKSVEVELQEKMGQFFSDHAAEIEELDRIRERRNKALDDAKQSLREDAMHAPYTKVKCIKFSGFKIQKKWTSWFITEMFVSLVKSMGQDRYDSAVDEGVIQVKTVVDGKMAEEWLRKNSLVDKFRPTMDGKELTPAVTGPKPIPPLGAEEK